MRLQPFCAVWFVLFIAGSIDVWAQDIEILSLTNGDRLTGISWSVVNESLSETTEYFGTGRQVPNPDEERNSAVSDSGWAPFDDAFELAIGTVNEWTKRVEFGGRFLKGNSDEDHFALKGRFEKQTKNRYTEFDVGGEYGQNRKVRATNRWFGAGTWDFAKEGQWIFYVSSKNEFDEFQNLDYRGTLSSGLGYRFFNEKQKRLIVRLGPAVTLEVFHRPVVRRTTPDVFAELESRWPLFARTQFENKTTLRPSVSDLHVFRLTTNSGLLVRLDDHERWRLKLGVRIDHNSRPNLDRMKTDFTTSLSIVYTRK